MKRGKKFKVLIACEKSQAVCKEFRKLGIAAWSCDTQECTGEHPEWHFHQDVIPLLNLKWDLVIAFPPCTDLAVSGSKSFEAKQKDGRQQASINFFMQFTKLACRYAIENPIGIMSTHYRKPDQIVQPYFWGDSYKKSTCLWLNGLPKLTYSKNDMVEPEFILYKSKKTKMGYSKYSKFGKLGKGKGDERSVTPIGLAKAMAEQWSKYLRHEIYNTKYR